VNIREKGTHKPLVGSSDLPSPLETRRNDARANRLSPEEPVLRECDPQSQFILPHDLKVLGTLLTVVGRGIHTFVPKFWKLEAILLVSIHRWHISASWAAFCRLCHAIGPSVHHFHGLKCITRSRRRGARAGHEVFASPNEARAADSVSPAARCKWSGRRSFEIYPIRLRRPKASAPACATTWPTPWSTAAARDSLRSARGPGDRYRHPARPPCGYGAG
jgi:hypothetical protein